VPRTASSRSIAAARSTACTVPGIPVSYPTYDDVERPWLLPSPRGSTVNGSFRESNNTQHIPGSSAAQQMEASNELHEVTTPTRPLGTDAAEPRWRNDGRVSRHFHP